MTTATIERKTEMVTGADHARAIRRLEQISRQSESMDRKAVLNLHESVRLCSELLQNREWLEEHHFDEAGATEYLDRKYINRQVHGAMSLHKLLAVYSWKPEAEWWEEQHFNLKIIDKKHNDYLFWKRQQEEDERRRKAEKLRAEMAARGQEPPVPIATPERTPRTVPVAVVKEKEQEIRHQRAVLRNTQKELDRKAAAIGQQAKRIELHRNEEERLRARVAELESELAKARKYIAELEARLGICAA